MVAGGARVPSRSVSRPPIPLADLFLSPALDLQTLCRMTIATKEIPGGLLPRSRGLTMGQKLLHYDVIERLGEGARSVIYAVSDPVTKQLYALKHVVRTD